MKIREITRDKQATGRFLIEESQYKTAKNGKPFISMKLVDATGEINMKIWDANEELFRSFPPGRILEITGISAREFNQQLQLELDGKQAEGLRLLSEHEIDYAEFFPTAIQDREEIWEKLKEMVGSVQEPHLKALLEAFYGDEKFCAAFRKFPAALKRHHVYIGGLLEHTYGVASLCLAAVEIYPGIDRDLLLAGALLHDIGKVRTYEISRTFEGTDEGKLIGHLLLGVEMVGEKIGMMSSKGWIMPEENRLKLLHLLISHHGIMEWGSPVEPLFLEGCLLHHADNMDAQAAKFLAAMRNHDPVSGKWTAFDASLGRSVYIGSGWVERETAGGEE
ncbi:MAG: 3'-5' exoribonuclease YhaM family protein [Bacillota bacterium]